MSNFYCPSCERWHKPAEDREELAKELEEYKKKVEKNDTERTIGAKGLLMVVSTIAGSQCRLSAAKALAALLVLWDVDLQDGGGSKALAQAVGGALARWWVLAAEILSGVAVPELFARVATVLLRAAVLIDLAAPESSEPAGDGLAALDGPGPAGDVFARVFACASAFVRLCGAPTLSSTLCVVAEVVAFAKTTGLVGETEFAAARDALQDAADGADSRGEPFELADAEECPDVTDWDDLVENAVDVEKEALLTDLQFE